MATLIFGYFNSDQIVSNLGTDDTSVIALNDFKRDDVPHTILSVVPFFDLVVLHCIPPSDAEYLTSLMQQQLHHDFE